MISYPRNLYQQTFLLYPIKTFVRLLFSFLHVVTYKLELGITETYLQTEDTSVIESFKRNIETCCLHFVHFLLKSTSECQNDLRLQS